MNSFLRKLGIEGGLEQKMFWIFVAILIASELFFELRGTVQLLLPLSIAFIGIPSVFLEWQDFFLSPFIPEASFFGQITETILAFKSDFPFRFIEPLLSPPRSRLA